MVFYFSSTGNSGWAAMQIASCTMDEAVNITGYSGAWDVTGQTVGFVFPVYAWGAPEPVLAFAGKLSGKPKFSYAICTCGSDCGNTMNKLSKAFPIASKYSIAMPSNYIMGADVEDETAITEKIGKAKQKLIAIGRRILDRAPETDIHRGSLPWIKSSLANFGFNRFARSTKPFFATGSCISCGLCEKNCPAQTIKITNGKPIWGKTCYQCTACINRCPVSAIQYGEKTRARGRYYFGSKAFTVFR